MNMYDFWLQYGDTIIQTIALVGVTGPFLRSRVVNDKNIIGMFENLKQSARTIDIKNIDINQTLSRMNASIDVLQADFINNQKMLESTIQEFTDLELIQELKEGVAIVKDFNETLQVKDKTIERMMNEIKKTRKELEEIKNKIGV